MHVQLLWKFYGNVYVACACVIFVGFSGYLLFMPLHGIKLINAFFLSV